MSAQPSAPAVAPDDPLLHPREVAARYGCSLRLVQLLCSRGRLEHVRVGRNIRIPASAAEAYLAAQHRPAVTA